MPEDLILRLPSQIRENERFMWQDADKMDYLVLVADEFELPESVNIWKMAVAGEKFSTDQKGGSHKDISLRIPMIFISNSPLKDYIPGIKERLTVIQAFGSIPEEFHPRNKRRNNSGATSGL